MQIKFNINFNKYEIEDTTAYKLIAEFSHSSIRDTGRVKRAFNAEFTPEEQEIIKGIDTKCNRWYLKTGIPETLEVGQDEYIIWCRYVKFIWEVWKV